MSLCWNVTTNGISKTLSHRLARQDGFERSPEIMCRGDRSGFTNSGVAVIDAAAIEQFAVQIEDRRFGCFCGSGPLGPSRC